MLSLDGARKAFSAISLASSINSLSAAPCRLGSRLQFVTAPAADGLLAGVSFTHQQLHTDAIA